MIKFHLMQNEGVQYGTQLRFRLGMGHLEILHESFGVSLAVSSLKLLMA